MSTMSRIGKAMMTGANKSSDLVSFAENQLSKVTVDPVLNTGAYAVKKSFRKAEDGRRLWNGYTGYQSSWTGVGIATGAAVGYTAIATPNKQLKESGVGTTSYSGAAPIMNADGVGNRTSAPTLGASGSMVFGLNNMRRG